ACITIIRSPGIPKVYNFRNTEMWSTPALVRVSLIKSIPCSKRSAQQYVIHSSLLTSKHLNDGMHGFHTALFSNTAYRCHIPIIPSNRHINMRTWSKQQITDIKTIPCLVYKHLCPSVTGQMRSILCI